MTDTNENDAVLDPIAVMILDELERLEAGKALRPDELAKVVAELRRKPNDGPQLWRRYMNAARQQTLHLARTGKIEIVRKGKVVDPRNPDQLKGIWKARLPLEG
jgi:hypothetical protein